MEEEEELVVGFPEAVGTELEGADIVELVVVELVVGVALPEVGGADGEGVDDDKVNKEVARMYGAHSRRNDKLRSNHAIS